MVTPALKLDEGVRHRRNGRVLLGGHPFRVVRLSDAGAATLHRLLAGCPPVGADEHRLARRLLDAGIAMPVMRPRVGPHGDVAVVIPALDPPPSFARTIAALAASGPDRIVVVDDGSTPPIEIADIDIIRTGRSRGPGGAREVGWRSVAHDIVVFVDADVVPTANWLDRLLGHLDDPEVAAVAPRIRSAPGRGVIARYERHASPLDLGCRPAVVRPGSPVPYVPTAALVVRRDALVRIGGFDPDLPVGEDVDLVWRLAEAGLTVRYEPAAELEHLPRPTWRAWVEQRRRYGTSAATLVSRHGTAAAPLVVTRSTAAVLVLAAAGRRTVPLSMAVLAAGTIRLALRLRGRVDRPGAEAVGLVLAGMAHAVGATGAALRRSWLPIALVGSVISLRVRVATMLALLVPPLRRWLELRPELDPFRWVLVSTADDGAYCLGVWQGALRRRSFAALMPRLTARSTDEQSGHRT